MTLTDVGPIFAQMGFEKFKQAILHICWKCQNPSDLGSVKLNKILLYSDFYNFALEGKSITGESYVKRQHGPVPKRILIAVADLERDGLLAVRKSAAPYQPTEYFARARPTLTEFTPDEVSLLDDMIDWIVHEHTASSISKLSHDAAWEVAANGEEIPLHALLATSQCTPNQADIDWAIETIKAAAA